jgi:RNA polymerase sigma-70 factor (ECF subfamily)
MNENMVIQLAKEGHDNAFRRLYEDNRERIYRLACRYVRSRQDAEDIMQETFIRAFKRIDSFHHGGDAGFSTWLASICIHCAIDHLRRQKRRRMGTTVSLQDVSVPLEAEGDSPQRATEMNETRRIIAEAAGRLAPKQRIIFDLRYMQHHTIKEISQIMSCNENTVKTHLSRSMQKLKKKLEPLWRER